MKVVRGYKTELDPTHEQYVLLCQCAGIARFAYNYGLARKQDAYQAGQKTPYAVHLHKELTARKHDDLGWLDAVSKWIVQNALRDLDDAFKHFFRKVALKKQGQWKVGLDGDEIVRGHIHLHKKVQNIQRDARVALSMVMGGKTGGLDNYLVINGRARITEGGAPELLNQLAQIYIGPGTPFIPDEAPSGYITRITAEQIHGIGPWNESH